MHDLKPGDIVNAEFDGNLVPGSVLQLNRETGQVCLATNDDQETWYTPDELYPVHLGKAELENLQFKASNGDGGIITYVRGPFSVEVHDPSNFEQLTLLYRSEAPRVFQHGLALHELQNHYLDMTKVHLIDRAGLED